MERRTDELRTLMWSYYDRRAHREPGPQNVLSYFVGLGVDADPDVIASELGEVDFRLRGLPHMTFVDVGAGPNGTFTRQLPGRGIAVDQSDAALRRLRVTAPGVPAARADAMALPMRSKAVGRVFISHLYGLLLPDERAALLAEAWRVGDEIVILDSGRPPGAQPEEWQTRTLPDGSSYSIYRRHLDVDTLLRELGGEALFGGDYFVLIRVAPNTRTSRGSLPR